MVSNNSDKIRSNVPTLPLRDVVVFPDMIFPLFVGRKKSVQALEQAMLNDKTVFLATQKNPATNDVTKKDIYKVGCIGVIVQMLKLPDGTLKVLVETKRRASLSTLKVNKNTFLSDVEFIEESDEPSPESKALVKTIKEKYKEYIKIEERIPSDLVAAILEISDASKLADHVVSSLPVKIAQKQEALEALDIKLRLELVYDLLKSEFQVLQTENKIKNRIKNQVETSQREYYLNEQLKAIKKELGENIDDSEDEIKIFENLIQKKKLTKEAKNKANSELKKLKTMNPLSSEAGIVRGYLDWLLNIPWNEKSKIDIDLDVAEKTLNRDHYALKHVKERILEFIAVNKRVTKIKGPILCLVGPPGVGKTSLAKAIAESMGRKFVRMSLGGMRDEAEIRGHRRTYIGALPGKIVQLMKKAKTSNPLFLLDEIDKIGQDFRGDPASALLEVLDPEQNSTFSDHYLEVDYDLSDIMFITTANSLNIPHALQDRMEVIKLSGYTAEEKLQICKKHLLAKQKEFHGLKKNELNISDGAILKLISNYTYEAGVRNLEREIANLARKATRKIDTSKKISKINIGINNLVKYAGIPKFDYNKAEGENLVGVSTGLAYTEFGGDILAIESVKTIGDAKITSTGKLGEVMKESVHAAFSFFKSRSADYGVLPEEFKKYDIHLHVPEGGIPKDGPSAGIAIFTSIVSVMTDIPVNKNVAMTGEITLRGRVLPIGGLKEKLLAALRGGIKTVLIPKKNNKDLSDIPDNIKKKLKIILVESVEEVLPVALVKLPKSPKWEVINKQKATADKISTH